MKEIIHDDDYNYKLHSLKFFITFDKNKYEAGDILSHSYGLLSFKAKAKKIDYAKKEKVSEYLKPLIGEKLIDAGYLILWEKIL